MTETRKIIKKCAAVLFAALIIAGSLYGCSKTSGTSESGGTDSAITSLKADEMFTDRDVDFSYDAGAAVSVSLADGATTEGSGVSVDGNSITITAEGVYVLSGSLSEGQIIVDAKNAKVQLVLNGVSITNSSSAAIYVKAADKVFITTAEGSENSLDTTGEFVQTDDDNVDGAIFSKSDLTINGAGSLAINSAYGSGIVSKDDLKLTGGSVSVTAAKHALEGKDSVRIKDGDYTLTAGTDGIHSENTDDEEKGFIFIAGGNINITAEGDGLDAEYILQLEGGSINATTAGGARTGAEPEDSAKGLKSDTSIIIKDGELSLYCADDAIHSNGDIYIVGGNTLIESGDDGIHADTGVNIGGGNLDINYSYEGIEGTTITITDGDIVVHASDDGLNSSGGNDSENPNPQDDFRANEDCSITISGGKLYVNSDGDGIDSNGSISIKGGETYIEGAENGGNAAFDYAGTASIEGGTLIAVGYSAMAQNFTVATQGTILATLSAYGSGDVSVADSSGNVLASYSFSKTFNSVLISTPNMDKGETYTLTAGDETQVIALSDYIYGSAAMGNGGMPANPKGPGRN